MGFGQVHGSDEFHFDARSRGQSISRSVVWHIFMKGIAFISTEEECEDRPAPRPPKEGRHAFAAECAFYGSGEMFSKGWKARL